MRTLDEKISRLKREQRSEKAMNEKNPETPTADRGPMTSDEFLANVRAILEPLERMQADGGGYAPDIIETGDAMERLADRWYRCDVKKRLNAAEEAERTIAELRAEVEALKQLDRAKAPCGHFSAYLWTEDGGKTITCLLCARATLTEKNAELTKERDAALLLAKQEKYRGSY